MRYKPGHKEASRARILEAVGRGFRRHGVGGVGVDGLAREAGVTSGAFYDHFPNKSAAFEEAAIAGLKSLLAGIEALQAEQGGPGGRGQDWIEVFVDFYLGFKRTCELGEACGLQALTPEVIRAEATVRTRYEAVMSQVVDRVAQGLPDRAAAPPARERAWALLALLSGGVAMARATGTEAMGEEIAGALKRVALAIAG